MMANNKLHPHRKCQGKQHPLRSCEKKIDDFNEDANLARIDAQTAFNEK